jgi:putative ABC transport system permease protein
MGVLQDLRIGLRILGKSKNFTLIALMTLALGIGASTAVFSIVDAILLKPLPYPHAERIVIPWRLTPPGIALGYSEIPWGLRAVRLFWQESKTLQDLAAFQPDSFNLTGAGDPVHLQGVRASAAFFPALGVMPALGRAFTFDEDQPGHAHEVVLSDRLWRERFGAAVGIIGHPVTLNSSTYMVVGVMPPNFVFPRRGEMPGSFSFAPETQIWVPLALPASLRHAEDPDELALIGRLRPGVTVAQAQAEMDVFAKRLESMFQRANGWFNARVTPLASQVVGDTRAPLLLILGAVGVVLLIACSNVAGLLLTRALGRRREFTLRAALGAARGRLVRQLLTESLLLAAAGGVAGIALARGAIAAVQQLGPPNIPRLREVSLDPRVFLFAMAVTFAAGILFGLAPALGAARTDLAESLNAGGQRTGGGPSSPRLRNALLVAEVALALVLTVAAGLLVRTFYRLLSVDGGFNAQQVMTFELSLPESKYGEDKDRIARFYHAALDKLRLLPGVEAAGIGEVVPLGGAGESTGIRIPGRLPSQKSERLFANFTIVSSDYFSVVGTPIVRGRPILESDTVDSLPVALINRAMAQKYWPGEDPIGKQVGPGSTRYPVSVIVGIVADLKHLSLREEPAPEMYVPYTQRPWPAMLSMQVALRAKVESSTVIAAARETLHSLDPDIPVGKVSTLASIVDDSMTQPRFSMMLMAAFGVLAVVLASIGMYGVVSYSVMQRTREIGIRIALGAERRDVFRMVIAQGARLGGLGIAIGLAGALAATRLIANQLYGVQTTDPLTFAAVAILLIIVVLLACYVPARRAMRVEPTAAVRHE